MYQRTFSFLVPVLLSTALTACDGGCGAERTARWVEERQNLSPAGVVDCPPGLAKCEAGSILLSRAHRYRPPCRSSPEECSCPWDVAGTCDRGCSTEEVVLADDVEAAMRQLCGSLAVPLPDAELP